MKKMILIYSVIIFIACDTNDENQLGQDFQLQEERGSFIRLPNYSMPQDHIEAFVQLGFGGCDVVPGEREYKSIGKKHISYIVDGDIEMNVEELLSLAKVPESLRQPQDGRTQQYRTNVIANPGVYRISTNGFTPTLKLALRRAVENFNNEGLGISFVIKFPEEYSSLKIYNMQWAQYASIHVSPGDLGGAGGLSGFPSANGTPYPRAQVDYSTADWGLEVCEHVFTHELGHCIGFRHTDYFSRSSCSFNWVDEGDAGVGAIHIPGTPTTISIDRESIMKACFNGTETGEFTEFDRTALNTLF